MCFRSSSNPVARAAFGEPLASTWKQYVCRTVTPLAAGLHTPDPGSTVFAFLPAVLWRLPMRGRMRRRELTLQLRASYPVLIDLFWDPTHAPGA